MNKFAERLRDLRQEQNLTRFELAKNLGMSAACIGRWERGLRTPNIDSIILLCKFFQCTADYLIGLEEW